MEAPTVFDSTVPLLPYDKAAFAGLKAAGRVELVDEIWLVEGNDTVSVPESVPGMRRLLGSGFSVRYTGCAVLRRLGPVGPGLVRQPVSYPHARLSLMSARDLTLH